MTINDQAKALRSAADLLERQSTLPTFQTGECDLREAVKVLAPYDRKFVITLSIELEEGAAPDVEFAVDVYRGKYSTDQRFTGKSLTVAVNQAIAFMRSLSEAKQLSPVATAVDAVATLTQEEF